MAILNIILLSPPFGLFKKKDNTSQIKNPDNKNQLHATNTLTIRPQAGAAALSITSASATGTILIDNGDYITFDGRAGGAGPSQLTISNTTVTGYAIQLINNAIYNTVKYCTVAGVNTGTASGVIFFSTSVGLTNGNSFNTIDNCDIKDGATTPTLRSPN